MRHHAAAVLFGSKLLLLLPLLIILPITTAFALRPITQQWQTTANVWVDPYKQLYSADNLGYTPALSQADLLNNFIRTRSFAQAVLEKTSIASQLRDPGAADKLERELPLHVHASPSSNSFITVGAIATDRELSLQILQACLAQFQQILAKRVDTQNQTAIDVYQADVADSQSTLSKAQQALAAYLADHPDAARRTQDSDVSAVNRDPTLARLFDQVNAAQGLYAANQQKYQSAVQSAGAGHVGQSFTFSVIDPPRLPVAPTHASRLSRLKLPLIGGVLGLLLSAGVGLALVLTNQRVLGAYDVTPALSVPVLAEIPRLRANTWRWQRKQFIRRWFSWRWERKPRDVVRLRLALPARASAPERGTV